MINFKIKELRDNFYILIILDVDTSAAQYCLTISNYESVFNDLTGEIIEILIKNYNAHLEINCVNSYIYFKNENEIKIAINYMESVYVMNKIVG